MVDGIAQPRMAGLAHHDDASLAAATHDGGDATQHAQGQVVASCDSVRGLSEQHGEDDPSDSWHGAQDCCVVLTVAFEKKLKDVFARPGDLRDWNAHVGMRGRWNAKKLKRLLRVANLVSLLIGGLGRNGQSVYWISDEDDIFANESHKTDVARLMAGLGNLYIRHTPGQLGLGTTSTDPGDRREEDLVAVANLVAGATAEILTKRPDALVVTPRQFVPRGLHPKTLTIGNWIADPHPRLRLPIFVCQKSRSGKPVVRTLRLDSGTITLD